MGWPYRKKASLRSGGESMPRESILRDRLAQDGSHQVDVLAARDEGRGHDGDVAGGLHVQSPIEELRLQLRAAHPGSSAGLELDTGQETKSADIRHGRQVVQP